MAEKVGSPLNNLKLLRYLPGEFIARRRLVKTLLSTRGIMNDELWVKTFDNNHKSHSLLRYRTGMQRLYLLIT